MSRIWERCRGQTTSGLLLQGTLWRMVESQEQVATLALVDNLHEQALLEELLERSKPAPPRETARLHYLLYTPFRYPPLRHGSRFGGRFEPSLFYGALGVSTLLAEAAYYRLLFLEGMSQPPPGALNSQHTAFTARYRSPKGLRLQDPPFDAHDKALCDPADYRETQALGGALRAAGVEAFEYRSARDPGGGLNIALFTPKALYSRRPQSREAWLCRTTADAVEFRREGSRAVQRLYRELFLVDGRLPAPAL